MSSRVRRLYAVKGDEVSVGESKAGEEGRLKCESVMRRGKERRAREGSERRRE